MTLTSFSLLVALALQDPAPSSPDQPDAESHQGSDHGKPSPTGEKPKEPTAVAEPIKTLIDRVKERVVKCEEALTGATNSLRDFESELTGKSLAEIDFRTIADGIAASRGVIQEALKNSDVLLDKIDEEILSSMKEDESWIFGKEGQGMESEKAEFLTDSIRTILELHQVLPGDSLAKTSLEMLAEKIDRALTGGGIPGELPDLSTISGDIIRALMEYRRSLEESFSMLGSFEQILSIMENKSRDLAHLLSREAGAADKTAHAHVQSLLKGIKDGQSQIAKILQKMTKRVKHSRGKEEPGEKKPDKSKMDSLREKYMGTPSREAPQ